MAKMMRTVLILTLLLPCVFSATAASISSTKVSENSHHRKLLSSSRPVCIHKCLGCNPCVPTLVPIQLAHHLQHQGDSVYYPVTWRCSCGTEIFDPHASPLPRHT